MAWGSWRNYYMDVVTFTAMLTMEFLIVGVNTLFKAATLKGMSYHVFLVYDYVLAALLLLPAPFFSYRYWYVFDTGMVRFSKFFHVLGGSLEAISIYKTLSVGHVCRKGFSFLIFLQIKGASSTQLLDTMQTWTSWDYRMMGYTGIIYSSPTLSSAISNLTPAFTFILAILFRMEKVVWKKSSSKAKVMGTIISVTGALVVTLYKGPAILKASEPSMSLHQPLNLSETNLIFGANLDWIFGGVFLTVQYILIPLWLIVLTQIIKEYPAELTVIFFYNLCVSFMALLVGLVVERNPSAWRLRPDIALVSIVLSAVFSSCLNNIVHSWALRLRGPVFVAMFKPFSIAVAFAMGIIFLSDTLYIGSLIGAITISIGFYTVLWGKAKEGMPEDSGSGTTIDSPSSERAPLLRSDKDGQV